MRYDASRGPSSYFEDDTPMVPPGEIDEISEI